MTINLNDIFNLTGSVIYNPDNFKTVSKISTDSRTIKANSLYVALKGNKFDGHNFVNDAIKNGATSVMINKSQIKKFSNLECTFITVPNTTIAYGELASIFRKKFKGKVVSITGSNGKTTTKEILNTILSEKFKTEKTIANNNNHIGIPKTIFDTKNSTEILVLEHGTNHFGEIEYTANIAMPNFAIITNIGDSHLEYLVDQNGVYNEKSHLFTATLKNSGTIFVNSDDSIIKSATKNIKEKITFGFKGNPNVKAKLLGFTTEGMTKISIQFRNELFELSLPIYGFSNAKNFLASISVALHLGLTKTQIFEGINKLQQVKGRLFVEQFPKNMLIDDTYNANPTSLEAAIDLVKNVKTYSTKTLILGDMFELGENADLIHKQFANQILKSKIQNVFTLGKLMENLSAELQLGKINSKHFANRKNLHTFIEKNDFSNQVILIKGSRGMKMEEFVKQLREKIN